MSAIQQVDSRVAIDLKWPNDVLIDGKKVCGILTEMNAEATRVRYIVVGIGINVNQASFPKELAATSLRLVTGSEWSRVDLVAALLKSLDREYRQLLEDPDARQSILRRFAGKSSWVQGKAVRIEENGASLRGHDRRPRSPRLLAGQNRKGDSDRIERNRTREVKRK